MRGFEGQHLPENVLREKAWTDTEENTAWYNFNLIYRKERDKMYKLKQREKGIDIFSINNKFYFNHDRIGMMIKNPVVTSFSLVDNCASDECFQIKDRKPIRISKPEYFSIELSISGEDVKTKDCPFTESEILKDMDSQQMIKALYNKIK